MERYEVIKDIGSGNFGVAKLVRDVRTKELFAVKFIERGMKVTDFIDFLPSPALPFPQLGSSLASKTFWSWSAPDRLMRFLEGGF